MKKHFSFFSICCVVFCIFSVFMFWYLPSVSSVRSLIAETEQNLEVSRGRELRQQAEYDKAAEELPLVQAELQEKEPAAEAAEKKVADLKSLRKELRAEKERLEKEINPDRTQDETSETAFTEEKGIGEEDSGNE